MCPTGRHKIDRFYSTECDNILISPGITHDTHRLNRQKHRKGLTHGIIKISSTLQNTMAQTVSQVRRL